MKKIIFTVLVFLITFLIYFFNRSEKIYYLSLGDYLSYGINNFNTVNNSYSNNIKEHYKENLDNYVNYSTYDDYRVMDLINDINYNKVVEYDKKEYKLQNVLIKANLITISIGMNDLIYKSKFETNLYEYTDDLINDIEKLLGLVRKYNKDAIYLLGFYNVINNDSLIDYANKRLEIICKKNKIKFVNIEELTNYIVSGVYPTNDGYKYITNKILEFTKK
ncbi:MAG: hypothetical protein IJE04_04180 [Bacilli bacterium]|nr:hypothetical protein [Bacilli bacterium]